MMNIAKRDNVTVWLDRGILILLGSYVIAYSCYTSVFAEIAVHFHFLPFPIFVGEILLIVCLLGLSIKLAVSFKQHRCNLTRWHYVLLIFISWILINALWGYYQYGPLAFRNAALFYYSCFAVIAYYFFPKKVDEGVKWVMLALIWALIYLRFINYYYLWFHLALLFMIVLSFKEARMKYVGMIMASSLVVLNYRAFFIGSRSHMVSMISVFLFLWIMGMMIYGKKLKLWHCLLIGLGIVTGLLFGLRAFSDLNQITSMTTPKEIIRQFKERDLYIKEHKKAYHPQALAVGLYNPNYPRSSKNIEAIVQAAEEKIESPKKVERNTVAVAVETPVEPPPVERPVLPEGKHYRSIDNAYGNSVFRLLIWRDMFVEIWQNKALFGINFGKPQRSESLEITGWAHNEWTRDGWITPHNSFLHMIYRGGLIGIIFILFIIGLIVRMVRDFLNKRSFSGILLVSALIYWIVLSQFLVILELPYIAIPFWSLFGITLAYAHQLTGKGLSENTSSP